jgi:geranylgeranyl diphosphate synthase type I
VSTDEFGIWRDEVREAVSETVIDFVQTRCAEGEIPAPDVFAEVLLDFFIGGKCLRSTFMYLGWLSGAQPELAAMRASASLELLHAFALLQDDVMDRSPRRRGRPSAHVSLANWHRKRRMRGGSERFGESAAILLGDLCLVWSEQLLRESGCDAVDLARAWPRYDAMRTELAGGQLAELIHDGQGSPPLAAVRAVARRKSGNYTVRRPLELGAALADCPHETIAALGDYGGSVGEAFQLRDDLLGIFGTPSITGKSVSGDLTEHKATSVIVAAHQLARGDQRRQLAELMATGDLDEIDIDRWRKLIVVTGAVELIENMIDDHLARALRVLQAAHVDDWVCAALTDMAAVCTRRSA